MNLWMYAFFVSFSVLIVISINYYYDSHIENSNFLTEAKSSFSSCSPCDYISSTPSWLVDGRFAGSGYQPNITTEIMIENNITLIYRDGCSWCELQIIKLDLEKLTKEGLAIKC